LRAGEAAHRFKRGHRLGVIVGEQVRLDAERRRHLHVSMNRLKAGISAATPRLA
jgi:hypothetical protein